MFILLVIATKAFGFHSDLSVRLGLNPSFQEDKARTLSPPPTQSIRKNCPIGMEPSGEMVIKKLKPSPTVKTDYTTMPLEKRFGDN